MSKPKAGGSRFLYEPFDETNARLATHEAVLAERWNGLERRLEHIESALERMERRLWLAVFGVVSVVLARGVITLIEIANT